MNKNYLQKLTRNQLLKVIDEDTMEYEDLHKGVSSIEEAWLVEESLYDYDKSRFEKEIGDIKKAELERTMVKRDEYLSYLRWLEVYFTYHHLKYEEKPYWKQCIERIEELL